MTDLLPRIDLPEIVIGLVAPIGTPLGPTIDEISARFEEKNYRVRHIRVTGMYEKLKRFIKPDTELSTETEFERYETYIAYGNQIRGMKKPDGDAGEDTDKGQPAILAALAIERIVEERIRLQDEPEESFKKTIYILDQFKRPEEIDLLRAVYGKIFFQVSVYSRRPNRIRYLANKFAENAASANADEFAAQAEILVNIDHNEASEKFGQRVSKIFHDADFIVNKDIIDPSISDQVRRFVELVFSSNSFTPTKIEYGMFAAKSAALRTSDLSRQVGAAIFTPQGEILSLGSNEVPKAGGGTYWPDERTDDRDFRRRQDSNEKRKWELLGEVLGALNLKVANLSPDERKRLEDSGFMDALEYGRIVHAEMCAITDAARLGHSIEGATLYSTAFPCHLCAKHIVAAGLRTVVFLEPYPKSLAARLHSDSLSIEGRDRGDYRDFEAVEFVHFYGITPRRYREFFQRSKRKDSHGDFVPYIDETPKPFVDIKLPFYEEFENLVVKGNRIGIDGWESEVIQKAEAVGKIGPV